MAICLACSSGMARDGVRDSLRRQVSEDRVAVIGLGRFGTSVARTLHELGYEVTAIDRGEKQIREAANFVTLAAQGDGTDQDLLLQLNVQQSAVAVVAQGESLESSVLSTLLLKKLGVPGGRQGEVFTARRVAAQGGGRSRGVPRA